MLCKRFGRSDRARGIATRYAQSNVPASMPMWFLLGGSNPSFNLAALRVSDRLQPSRRCEPQIDSVQSVAHVKKCTRRVPDLCEFAEFPISVGSWNQ
jgi:hypothetical protein